MLVTSRSRLTGLAATVGAQLVHVDVLTSSDASELLVARLGERASDEPAAAQQLIRMCSGLPLALSIAAARAAARPRLQLADLARELARAPGQLDGLDAGDPAASVRAVFSWSYEQLSEPAAQLFRLLSVQAAPDIAVPAAASLAGIDPGQAQGLISELADANLIAEHAPGRYAFHDLLRAYAADLAASVEGEAGCGEAVHRMLDHCLHTAYSGSRLLNPARWQVPLAAVQSGVTLERLESVSEALEWFAAERQSLLAAVGQATDEGFDVHAWQLPWALMLFFDRQGHWHDQIAIQRMAIAAAQRLGDLNAEARAVQDLGTAFARLGAYAEAQVYFGQARELHRQRGDPLGEARTLYEIAAMAERQGLLREAISHAQDSLALWQGARDQAGQARALNAIGWFHALLGEYDQALPPCEQALRLTRGFSDPLLEACTRDSLGYIHFHLGHTPEAMTHYKSAIALIKEQHNEFQMAPMLDHLGDAHYATGEISDARQAWQEALAILEDLKQPEADKVRAKLIRLQDTQ